jgi:CHAT domain-containing protein
LTTVNVSEFPHTIMQLKKPSIVMLFSLIFILGLFLFNVSTLVLHWIKTTSYTLFSDSQVLAQSSEKVKGIQVPSIFKITLQGKTEAEAFSSIPGTLKISPSTANDPNNFLVTLSTDVNNHNGSLFWSSFIQLGQQQLRSKITVNGNQVRLEVNPSQQLRLDVSWFTLIAGGLGELVGNLPVGVGVKQGTLTFVVQGDSISGNIEADGISDLGHASHYEAKFTGQLNSEKFVFPEQKQQPTTQVVNTQKPIANSKTPLSVHKVGDSVEVLWKNQWYPAKVWEIQSEKYCITYEGYDRSWDECVNSDRIRTVGETANAKAEQLYKVGFNYLINQKYLQAVENLEQSLKISENQKSDDSIPQERALIIQERVLNSLSTAYAILGEFEKLKQTEEKHLKIAEQLHDPSAATIALFRLGSAYWQLGDYGKAESYLQQALVRSQYNAPASRGFVFSALGLNNISLGKAKEAIAYFEQALEIAKQFQDPELEMASIEGLGLAYIVREDYNQAIKVLEKSRVLAQQNQGLVDISAQANALNNLGYAFFRSGDLTKAEVILRESVKLWESQRAKIASQDINKADSYKISTFELQALTYGTLQNVLRLKKQPEAALEVAEQGRARAFIELLSQRLASEAVKQEIPAPASISKIREIAKAHNATLIEYSLIDDRPQFAIPGKEQPTKLLIWVVKPTGEVFLRQVDLKQEFPKISLKDLIASTRQSMGVSGRGSSIEIVRVDEPSQQEKLQQLYQILIEPIAKDKLLPQEQEGKIIFIPQGSLFLVPFPALRDANGKFLIENYTVAIAPSIQTLSLTAQQRQRISKASPGNALVLGNPTMPRVTIKLGDSPQQLPKLPGAEQEANEIAKLFKTKAFIGNKAKKSAILPLLSKAGIIHLATHGLLDDFKGLGVPGAIALAPSGNGQLNDGLLTANEILDLKLNAELVVLSACDTGRGRITGDGVIGLSRSLITAGVPSVIVSLWSVPDAPTAELMTEFYRNWLSGKLDKAQALRQAMLKTMENHPNPKDWAAFTLIGEAR